ncbi:MAG: 3-dehydroquinate dehydratase [Ignavibacteriales bacterium]|nr:3-dehydroquinate dehydratase [Ignavibacteriales bacterium]
MKTIAIINGPNLDVLEKRDSSLYGGMSFDIIKEKLTNEFNDFNIIFFQSNVEGEICSFINSKSDEIDGLIINPGAFTHSSIALRDSLNLLKVPVIEVHLSNISSRENFRKINLTTSIAKGYISGFKEYGYHAACYLLNKILN